MYVAGSPHNVCAVFHSILRATMTDGAHEEVVRKIAAVYRSLDTYIDHEGLTTESSENLTRLQDGLDRDSLAYH